MPAPSPLAAKPRFWSGEHLNRALPWLCFLLLLVLQNSAFGRFYPNVYGLLGHDFALSHASMLDGAYWFWQNGPWEVPWFTPGFCGGQPLFADPQSVYYSPIQWLTFIFPPTTAAHLTMLLATSAGYWGFYFLARAVFDASRSAAIVCGGLAMLNGFLPYRMLMGQVGYQGFLLCGFVAWMLLSRRNYLPVGRGSLGNVFWAGLAIAVMIQGGLTSLMVPTALGVLAVALAAALVGAGCSLRAFWLRGMGAVAFAFLLCAAKLLASATFMSHFMRSGYRLPGFSSWVDSLSVVLLSLVAPSQWMWEWATPRLSNVQWFAGPQEWAYQFGVCFMLLVLAAVGLTARQSGGVVKVLKAWGQQRPTRNWAPVAALLLVLAIPIAVLHFDPAWNALLKRVPTLSTTSFPYRWIIIWIPIGCVAGLLAWQVLERHLPRRETIVLLILFLVGASLEHVVADKSYYESPRFQNFRGEELDRAWAAGRAGQIPPIHKVVDGPFVIGPSPRNKAVAYGESYLRCYNPAYGYGAELLPVGRLQPGAAVLSEVAPGFLNLKNPACLIWPKENHCSAIGDEFTTNQRVDAQRFATRQPLSFEISTAQVWANRATLCALLIVVLGIVVAGAQAVLGWRRHQAQP